MKNIFNRNTLLFWAFHLFSLGAFWFPFTAETLAVIAGSYFVRMFFITTAYHRYFAHRAFEAGRGFQYFLAFMAMTSSQKGVLWWAGHHRIHHRHSDAPGDLHSPNQGFWWSHCGWFLASDHEETPVDRIRDFAKFPEIAFLDRHWWIPVASFFLFQFLMWGWMGVFCGGFLGTTLLWHGTFTINSLSHLWGSQRYETGDLSRNNPVLAFITLGEGWHNNHHYSPSAARNGFKWYEFDVTFYGILLFEKLGLVKNLRGIRRASELTETPGFEKSTAKIAQSH
jgi:stearoyl-CoA desaturase (delta-9 desaturase)